MDPTIIGIIGIFIMLALFMTRMPVAYVMALVGFVGIFLHDSVKGGLNLLSRSMYDTFSSYGLTTIPLFILMGQFAFNTGISRRLYDTAYTYLGSTRGGLAMATVSACTAFGAVCGSSPATAATMATVGLPEMSRYNYSDELATGSVASGGGLGMIMPPSVVLIVYGVLTEQSIGALFVSGIIPAILMTILFIVCHLHPLPPRTGTGTARAKNSPGAKTAIPDRDGRYPCSFSFSSWAGCFSGCLRRPKLPRWVLSACWPYRLSGVR